MRKIITIKLYPTKEQEKIMFLSIKANKFAYNWGIDFMSKIDRDLNASINLKNYKDKH